jgi:hypothetical protein
MLSEWRRPAHFRRLGRDGMYAFWRTTVGPMGACQGGACQGGPC